MSKYTIKDLLIKREELYNYFKDIEVMNINIDDTINSILQSVGE